MVILYNKICCPAFLCGSCLSCCVLVHEWVMSLCVFRRKCGIDSRTWLTRSMFGIHNAAYRLQDRFHDAVETLDITAMCVKRARRRLKFTTQLMQQLIPALPCQLFKGNSLDDHKSASFVLAKFALSEACWLATGRSKDATGIAVNEDNNGNSNGNHKRYFS